MSSDLDPLGQVAARLLAQYPVRVRAVERLSRGERSSTFAVQGEDRRYVLRVCPARPDRTVEHLWSELQWLEALDRSGLRGRVPAPVATRDGSALVSVSASASGGDGGAALYGVLLTWVPGRTRGRWGPTTARAVGALTAMLHEHAQGWRVPEGFERPPVDERSPVLHALPERLGALGLGDHVGRVRDALDRVYEVLRELGQDRRQVGPVHADIHHGNVLFEGDRAGVIDFDHCGIGPFACDLATTLFYLRARTDVAALREALLAGYRSVRGLDEAQVHRLPVLILGRHLELMSWVLGLGLAEPARREQASRRVAADLDELPDLARLAGLAD
ncbi:phosphotransferase enzyme family protein [Haliangium sp.]|uniref:phosphotransferase enzyme family protein n=1 Tax=Haliangium sp. TaxID=2663208 RepID=UPI003D1405EE